VNKAKEKNKGEATAAAPCGENGCDGATITADADECSAELRKRQKSELLDYQRAL